jgi:hypothetical protein
MNTNDFLTYIDYSKINTSVNNPDYTEYYTGSWTYTTEPDNTDVSANIEKFLTNNNVKSISIENGVLHNDMGPAIVFKDDTEEYWLMGIKRTKKQWNKEIRAKKIEILFD